jgi:hypothetical protein
VKFSNLNGAQPKMQTMPIFDMFYCPKQKRNICFCVDSYEVVDRTIKQIECKYWKKGKGCTYLE